MTNPQLILTLFGEGWTVDDILRSYPSLTPEALQAVLAYAAEAVRLPPSGATNPE